MNRSPQSLRVISGILLMTTLSQHGAAFAFQTGNVPKAVNVRFVVAERKVIINYDLIGEAGEEYQVSMFLKKESDSSRSYRPKLVSGAIGEGIPTGSGREIVWDLFKEIPNGLEGNDFYFVVTIEEEPGKFPWWTGAAVVGAGLIGLLVLSGGSDVKKESTLPSPPGRP